LPNSRQVYEGQKNFVSISKSNIAQTFSQSAGGSDCWKFKFKTVQGLGSLAEV
jgi:hypothetical protein